MGAGQSISQYIENNIEFSQTTEIVNEVASSSSVNATVTANVSISFRNIDELISDGDINITQFANVSVTTYSVTDSGIKADQIADLQNAISTDCKTMLDRANEDFGALLAAAQGGQNANTVIENAISTAVKQKITQRTVSELFSSATVNASGVLEFANMKKLVLSGDINVKQELVVVQVAQMMMQSVVAAVLDTTSVTAIANKVEDEVTATNTGLATVVESVGDAISGILQSSQFIFLVIGVVAVVIAIFYLKKSGVLKGGPKAMRGMPQGYAQGMPQGMQRAMPQNMGMPMQRPMPQGMQYSMPPNMQFSVPQSMTSGVLELDPARMYGPGAQTFAQNVSNSMQNVMGVPSSMYSMPSAAASAMNANFKPM